MRVKDVREKNAIRAVRSPVVAVLAFVVFAAPSVVLADGRVAPVVGNSTSTPTSSGCRIRATTLVTSLRRYGGSGSRRRPSSTPIGWS